MKTLQQQAGFGLVFELVLVAAVVAVAAAGYIMYQSHRPAARVTGSVNLATNLAAASRSAKVAASGGAKITVLSAAPAGTPVPSPVVSPSVTPSPAPSSSPTQVGTYKVVGTVSEAPTSPVCSVSKPCSAPVANHEVDIYMGTSLHGSVTTNSQGQFSVYVPKGAYTLRLNPAVGVGTQSWSFTESGQYLLSLSLVADTGIR